MNRLVMIIISAVVIIAASLFAWHRGNVHLKENSGDVMFSRYSDDHELDFLKKELELDDTQYRKISDLYKNSSAVVKGHKDILENKKREMTDLMNSPTFDEKKIRKTLEEISSQKIELEVIRFRQRYETAKILTDEQKIKFSTLLNAKGKKFREKHSKDIKAGDWK